MRMSALLFACIRDSFSVCFNFVELPIIIIIQKGKKKKILYGIQQTMHTPTMHTPCEKQIALEKLLLVELIQSSMLLYALHSQPSADTYYSHFTGDILDKESFTYTSKSHAIQHHSNMPSICNEL